ncbi:MAG TPA: ABC transporter ATP-binding protein [Chitinophagaceae bacterium]|jgi:ABC-2 type transport system ATP-binding protein|nr:ABC transporter ATP-binding protein [Chitinophagaceae bacterium]
MTEKIIQVNNLIKDYGNFRAVKGISFDVYKGEIFGLLGPNGAGKSTTLEIIETLREKTSGEVIVGGFDLDKAPGEIKKIIGVQLQASGYYPGLNLVELIDLFAGIYNRKVDPYDILRMVNLTISEEERRKLKDPAVSPEEKKKIQDKDKAKVQYKKLSGGQKQRFSIATTLINEPTIVFLDEPTTGLDPQARRSLWELVKTIRERGATVIITTHYMDEAEYLCDRVAIIDAGQIIALASPDKLIDELVDSGFERPKEVKKANLEDVFINLTGHALRED